MPERIDKTVLWEAPLRLRTLVGVLLSVAAACGAAALFAGKDVRVFLPLCFIAVLFILAMRYGLMVGIFGSLAAALIFFAHMLFDPIGSWRISSHVARQNLAWMVLGGVVLSYLFAPSSAADKS